MKVKIYGNNDKSKLLLDKVNSSLEELWLSDFIEVETTLSEELINELWITQEPALIIEEEAIDFKDVIFEWLIPEDEELKSMFISIIWWNSEWWCAPGWCGSWCSC